MKIIIKISKAGYFNKHSACPNGRFLVKIGILRAFHISLVISLIPLASNSTTGLISLCRLHSSRLHATPFICSNNCSWKQNKIDERLEPELSQFVVQKLAMKFEGAMGNIRRKEK